MLDFFVGLVTGGGLFALWKWISGWNFINLSLLIENRRSSSRTEEKDDLISVLKIKKGDRATLSLESIHYSISSDGKEIDSGDIDEVQLSEEKRSLNITPGEETQFALYTVVPTQAVCKITVTVTGRSLSTKHAPLGSWRITDFSVPVGDNVNC